MSAPDAPVLRRVRVVQQVEPEVDDDLEDVAEIEQREVQAVRRLPYLSLHLQVNAEDEGGFDQQVDNDEAEKVGYELTLAQRHKGNRMHGSLE